MYLSKNALLNLLLASSTAALSIPNIFAVAPVEGKKPACKKPECKKPACNTLQPTNGKYFKKADNKRKRTNIIIEQDWTSSTSGSTVARRIRRVRHHKHASKDARVRHAHHSSSLSVSLSESAEVAAKKASKKHQKRGVSYSDSEHVHDDAANFSKSMSYDKRSRRYMVVKVRPRKHRHHTRRITIQNCDESSTYAFDIHRRMRNSRSLSYSASRDANNFKASLSASNSYEIKKTKAKKGKKCPVKKCPAKKHHKREVPLIEGKKPAKVHISASQSYSASFDYNAARASRSYSASRSDSVCEFERVPVRVCKPHKPCRIKKICPRPKSCRKCPPKPCPKKECCKNKKNKKSKKASSTSSNSSSSSKSSSS